MKPMKSGHQGKEAPEFSEEVVQIDRVTRVVKGGRRMRFRATVVIGNRKGKVGYGIGKANEVTGAIKKAVGKAKKRLIVVPIVKETIPHPIHSKFKSAKIMLMPAGAGTGIIAGGSIRKVVELAGIKNILSKSVGSSNKLNTVKATWHALQRLKKIPQQVKTAEKIDQKKEEPQKEETAPNA